jgi:hypothetical protein
MTPATILASPTTTNSVFSIDARSLRQCQVGTQMANKATDVEVREAMQ